MEQFCAAVLKTLRLSGLGRKRTEKLRLFAEDLYLLRLGIRNAILNDYFGISDRSECDEIMQRLLAEMGLADRVVFVRVDDFEFLLSRNHPRIVDFLECPEIMSKSALFVDISYYGDDSARAKLMDNNHVDSINSKIFSVLSILRKVLFGSKTCQSLQLTDIGLEPSFIITITGWLLEYAVIYYIQSSKSCFQIGAPTMFVKFTFSIKFESREQYVDPVSFTIPSYLINDQIRSIIETNYLNWKERHEKKQYVIEMIEESIKCNTPF